MINFENETLKSLGKHVSQSVKIAITTHMHPDGDAIGSSVALYCFLKDMGKDVTVVLPHDIPDSLDFLLREENIRNNLVICENSPEEAETALSVCDLIFCLDYNAFNRTDMLEPLLTESKAPKILIDHHLFPDKEKFAIAFSETEISSTAELLFWILMHMPQIAGDAGHLPSHSAAALMTGMTTDTNNFANSVYPTTLNMASLLLAAGVDRDYILGQLYNGYREERVRLMGKLLYKNLTITEDGVAYMVLDRKTISKYAIKDGETEGFVNIPLSIATVRMSIFAKQDKDRFRISIRSKRGVSANRCAQEYFNGGGHELASGGKLMISKNLRTAAEISEYIKSATHKFMNGNE